jgi:Tol biopolymer transport system component
MDLAARDRESNREGIVWSRDGRTILFRSCAQSLDQYGCWYSAMDASGGLVEEVDARTYRNAYLGSPDGSRLAYIGDVGHSKFAIVIENQGDGSRQQLTPSDSGNAFPAWSPDGRQIAYSSDMDGNWEIYTVNADGSDLRRQTFDDAADIEPMWSPDGTRIAFASNRNGAYNLFLMDADGTNVQALTTGFWNDEFPKWRP